MRLALTGLALLAGVAQAAPPKVSSEAKLSDGTVLRAANLTDGLLSTTWAEGVPGAGEGSVIEVPVPRGVTIASVSIWPGNLTGGDRSLREYGRPHTLTVSLVPAKGEPVSFEVRVLDPAAGGPRRVDVPVASDALEGPAVSVRVTIDKGQAGGIYDHTSITEIAFNLVSGDVPADVTRLADWLKSAPGQAASKKASDEVDALYQRVTSNELGDRDALNELMARASDGAPFLRAAVQQRVPDGFRVGALPPDMDAIEALLKIKDASAIQAIDRAATRTTGDLSRALEDRAQLFRAYQDVKGGGSRVVPAFGQPGFEKGALRGFGEPLDITVDAFGGLFVADIANHRVQRFNFDGRPEKVWGAAGPVPSTAWFGGKRTWYASGSAEGVVPGEFLNPLALATIPGKGGDTLAVLDASGRVTLIGPQGEVQTTFGLEIDGPLAPGVGGEGHLVRAGKRLVAIWGNEVRVHELDGAQVGAFTLKEGVPTGAIATKDGKLGLVYGGELVRYSLDGFRHGDLLNGSLGEGFEAVGVALDIKRKLWAVLDTGYVVQFKAPGKVAARFQISPTSLENPRIAVFDGLVFVTSQDRILKLDAMTAERAP